MVPVEGLLGYVLLLVGFVFFCNGMTLLGKTGAKEVGVLNLAVAILIVIAAWKLHDLGLTAATALVSAFALIYVLVYAVFVHGYDAKGLGWFCLFGFVVFVWYGYHFYAMGAPGLWFGTSRECFAPGIGASPLLAFSARLALAKRPGRRPRLGFPGS